MSHRISRRSFLAGAAGAGLALPLYVPARAFGANDRLNIASVGVGGKGRGDVANTSVGQNVVAICDVDENTLGKSAKLYPEAATYNDWRRMLERKDIDAVTVSTPDHMHAPVAVSAMQLGKHVYVQKPLAHSLYEARQMQKIAAAQKVVTQMGNQGHNGSGYLTLVSHLQAGVIGKIKEAHAWSNRPIWPQGIPRPKREDPVPETLHWDLWLGVAPKRPFVGPEPGSKRGRGVYHPFNWRGWLDFGVGALGDMGCHIIDPVVWSCELGAPKKVWSDGPAPNGETYPNWGIIHYEFPGTKYTAGETFRMTWYDGGKKPSEALAPLPKGESLPSNGSLYIGEKGVALCPHGGGPQFLPVETFGERAFDVVPGNDHYMQWTNACKGQGKTTSNFDYACPLTETVLLGTVAIRFPGKQLAWNSREQRFTNVDEANKFVRTTYRKGWEVEGLSG